jgi:hypothetical protein
MDLATAQGTFPCSFGVGTTFELQLDARAFGEIRDGVHEREGLQLAHELYSISSPLAAKTIIEAPVGGGAERGSFFGVIRVWAKADETGSLAPEGGELGGNLDYVRRLSHLLYAPL